MAVRHRVRAHARQVGRRMTTVRDYIRGRGSRVAPFSGSYSGNPHLLMPKRETSGELRQRIREDQQRREERRKRSLLTKKIQQQEEVRAREGSLKRRLFRHATFGSRQQIRAEKKKVGEFFLGTRRQRKK